MNASEMHARVSIQHTLAVYANSVDSGDVSGIVGTFAPDARLEVSSGATVQGRDAIKAFYEPVLGATRPDRADDGSIPLLRHNLTTSRVEFESVDVANGSTYFMSVTRYGPDHSGRYIDRFVRHGDDWLLADRRIVVEWYATPSWYHDIRLKGASRPSA